MTLKKWLKKIALSPLSVLMGIPGDFSADTLREVAGPEAGPSLSERIMVFAGDGKAQFSTGIPDAAASEDSGQGADPDGNQGDDTDEGLDTPSNEDDQDADLDDEGDADDSTDTEADRSEEGKGTKKRTFDERMAEIESKLEAKIEARLAAQKQSASEEKPDFTVVDQAKVDEYIAETEGRIDDLRMEGKYREARKLSQQLDQLEKDLDENEKRREAFIARQSAKKATTDNGEAIRADLDSAAELYRQELKIDPAVWAKMGQWFTSQVETKPLVGEEFNDIFSRQGKVAAIRFAHEYTTKNMNQNVKQSNDKKEQTKNSTARLTTSNTGKTAPINIEKERAKLYATLPPDEAFMKLQELKRQVRAA